MHFNPSKQQPGIRAIIIEAFKKGDREAAYEAAKMANRRIGREVYTRQIVDSWIDEYEQVR